MSVCLSVFTWNRRYSMKGYVSSVVSTTTLKWTCVGITLMPKKLKKRVTWFAVLHLHALFTEIRLNGRKAREYNLNSNSTFLTRYWSLFLLRRVHRSLFYAFSAEIPFSVWGKGNNRLLAGRCSIFNLKKIIGSETNLDAGRRHKRFTFFWQYTVCGFIICRDLSNL